MQRSLTPACPAPSAGDQVWADASGVYGTRILVQKCWAQYRTDLLEMPSLRLALLRRHSRPDSTDRSTRPRCVGHPRPLSARQGDRGTVRRHHENLKSTDERNMGAAIGSGGRAAGDLSVGYPKWTFATVATSFRPRLRKSPHEALMGEDYHGWGIGGITMWCVREWCPRI